jgi:hypothetical protein
MILSSEKSRVLSRPMLQTLEISCSTAMGRTQNCIGSVPLWGLVIEIAATKMISVFRQAQRPPARTHTLDLTCEGRFCPCSRDFNRWAIFC